MRALRAIEGARVYPLSACHDGYAIAVYLSAREGPAMRWLNRISGYQFVLGWLALMCALAAACAIWPELDRLVTALSDPALYLGLLLAAGYMGWTAWAEIWKAHRRRKTAGQRGQVRR